MYCPNCGSISTKVKDTAPSHVDHLVNRGREYLISWGDKQLKELDIDTKAFVVRAIQCSECSTRYRTLEILVEEDRDRRRRS